MKRRILYSLLFKTWCIACTRHSPQMSAVSLTQITYSLKIKNSFEYHFDKRSCQRSKRKNNFAIIYLHVRASTLKQSRVPPILRTAWLWLKTFYFLKAYFNTLRKSQFFVIVSFKKWIHFNLATRELHYRAFWSLFEEFSKWRCRWEIRGPFATCAETLIPV